MGEDWIPFCQRDKLPIGTLMGICASTLASSLLWKIVFTLFYPLAARVEMPSSLSTIILLLGSLIGFIVQPLVGSISDGLTFKWGRRRIFIIGGGIILVAALLIIMFCDKLSKAKSGQQGFLIFGMVLVFTAGNVVQGPARTLCSDVCPPAQQVLISSIVGVYGGVGGAFTNLIGAIQLYKYTSLSQEQFILVVCLCISFACILITCIVAHEEQFTEKKASANPFAPLAAAFKNIDGVFLRVALTYCILMISSYQISIQFSPFLGETIYGGKNTPNPNDESTKIYQKGVSWAMLCNMVSGIAQFSYGFVQSKLCDKLGLKRVLIVTIFLVGTMFLLFFFVRNRIAFIFMIIPIGIGAVSFSTLPIAIISLISKPGSLGANLALLNCFNVLGQQISNFGIGMGIAKLWPGKYGHLIAISCVPAYIAGIAAFFLVVPSSNQVVSDEGMEDSEESGDSDHPAAL